MNKLFALLMAVMFASCSPVDNASQDQNVDLVNKSAATVYYMSVGLRTSTLIDVIGVIPAEMNTLPELKPSQRADLKSIASYEEEGGIAVICYIPAVVDGKAVVRYEKMVSVPYDKLKSTGEVVVQ